MVLLVTYKYISFVKIVVKLVVTVIIKGKEGRKKEKKEGTG
jgi:hypothetical protein